MPKSFSRRDLVVEGKYCIVTEPSNAVPPKITDKNINVRTIERDSVFVGLCPSQAFPVPAYR